MCSLCVSLLCRAVTSQRLIWAAHSSKQMRKYMETKHDDIMNERTGAEGQMQVTLREVDPFSLWVSY